MQLDPRNLLRVLRRRFWVLLLCLVLIPGAAFGLSLLQAKEYTASALLLFRDPGFDQQLFGSTVLPQSSDAAREAATNIRLVSVGVVAERTAAQSVIQGFRPGIDGDEIKTLVSVHAEGQADLAAVDATTESPRFSATLAEVFAQQFISYRRDSDRSTILRAQEQVRQRIASLGDGSVGEQQRRSLERQADQLSVLASLQTGNAELVQRAEVPDAASSPRPLRNVLVGLVLGVLVGTFLMFFFERLDRRIRTPQENEAIYERPILAHIPQSRGRQGQDLIGAGLEPFRLLHANLRYFDIDRPLKTVVVTSAAPGDGKTTVAGNLAIAAAESGLRVLLIEADLRRPSLGKRMRAPVESAGLSALLTSDMELRDAVQEVSLDKEAGSPGTSGSLDVLFSGSRPPNPADLLQSEHMANVLTQAGRDYELVVVDTPPMLVVADAIPVLSFASGVLVVSRLDKSRRDEAESLAAQLQRFSAPILGIVVNAVTSSAGYYSYEYGRRTESVRSDPTLASATSDR